MKKGFIGLLILLLCAWVQSAYGAAGDVASVNGKAITAVATVAGKAIAAILTIGGKSCADGDCTYTSMDALTGSGYTGALVGYNTTNTYSKAMSWTEANAASGYTVKRVSVRLKKVGSPTFTITVNICTNNATGPKPNVCTAIGTLSASSLTTSYVDYTVDYPTGYAIADSTRYWIALMPDAVGDDSNHVMWESSATGDENLSAAGSNGAWSIATDTSFAGYFSVYQCE